MNKVPLFRGAVGLNDKLDPLRGIYDAEKGAVSLYQANNVVYDLTGDLALRFGYTLLSSGEYHSVFSCGDYGICVCNGVLSLINADQSIRSLNITIRGKKVAYYKDHDGTSDRIFFSDGQITGIVRDGVVSSWTVGSYIGTNSTKAQVEYFMPNVPAGHLIHVFNGRMYIAHENILYVSEQLAFSWYNPELVFLFPSRITMINSVYTGLLVSDQRETIFMPGSGPEDFARVSILKAPVIEGSDVSVISSDIGMQAKSMTVFFAVSGEGIYSVDESGMAVSRTKDFLNFSRAEFSAALIDHMNQYIVTLLQ